MSGNRATCAWALSSLKKKTNSRIVLRIWIPSLITGDVGGHFNQLFQRVTSINRKNGPFELLLCVGSFFSNDQEQNDELIPYKNKTKKGNQVQP